jgi:hypothetical protein
MSKESKIAKIVDDHTLVITGGDDFEIEKGQRFEIIGKKGKAVTDPDTGEVLGTLDELKGIVKAITVYPHMTVVKSEVHEADASFPSATQIAVNNLATGLNAFRPRRYHEHLNVDLNQVTGGLSSDETSPIRIGDIVRPI